MEQNKISFGADESVKDIRIVTSDQANPLTDAALPENGSVDFSKSPVSIRYDQFQVGECTSEATTKPAEYVLETPDPFDPDWGYLMTKVLIDKNLIEGSSAYANLERARVYGIPSKAIRDKYPLNIQNGYAFFISDFEQKYGGKIPQEVLNDALKHKIPGYYQVALNPVSLANEINSGNPLIFRIAVGDNTYTDVNGNVTYSATKLLPFRAPNPVTGGHLICCNEYKGLTTQQLLSGPNSWGLRWCPETNGYWSFVFSTYKPYFTEAWAITKVPVIDIFTHKFASPITYGDKNAEVVALQRVLTKLGFLTIPKNIALGTYADLTVAAVLAFQRSQGITTGDGRNVGPATRTALNKVQGL